ncbi:MAG TPA: hypothetical protein VFX97_03700 [Pyrinomonadaceae bacterium]|nr:hypothetical protein [Pyrinomonadaceae bacterium]
MKSLVNLILLLFLPSLMLLGGCKNQNSANMRTADTPYAKVYVQKSGQVTLDGKNVTLEELDEALGALARRHGVVLYSREAPHEAQPHPIFKNVIDIVARNELPIRLCETTDCSDALTADGKLRIEN